VNKFDSMKLKIIEMNTETSKNLDYVCKF